MNSSKQYFAGARALLTFFMVVGVLACSSKTESPTVSQEPEPDPYATIKTFVGDGTAARGGENEDPLVTQLYLPQDITFGPNGLPYVVDWNNHRIRVIENGLIRTLIGTGELGDAPAGQALQIGLNHPTNVAFDLQGNLILAAWHNSKIMRMNLSTGYIEPICGDGTRDFRGDGGMADTAWLDIPSATVCDPQGRMYIADQANQRIRMVDTNGIITTVVGKGSPGFLGDGGPAVDALISGSRGQSAFPSSKIALDKEGNLYLADTRNHRIRMVSVYGIITTVAGNGILGFAGDGGPAKAASLNSPTDVVVDSEGNIYIADTFNSCIRKVNTDGIISTFAGQGGVMGYGGDGGAPNEATLDLPYGVALDNAENLYIADTHNHRIRVILK